MLDTYSVGFLTIKDLQINLTKYFNIELKQPELRQLFKEIDSNHSGIIRFSNFESFYNSNYNERV
jgi:Ca2+-binding EF-hand superfamily protein